jgi:hypothetical protein
MTDTTNTALSERFDAMTQEQQNTLLDEMGSTNFDALSEAEIDTHMNRWFGEGFTDQTKDIFAQAVLTVAESIQEDLASEYQNRIDRLESELIFREVTNGMVATDRERFRLQVEWIAYDDSFKTKLLSEKRRLFGKPNGNYDPLNEDYYEPLGSKPNPLHETAMKVISDMSRWGR